MHLLQDASSFEAQWKINFISTPQWLLEQGFPKFLTYVLARICGWIADGINIQALTNILCSLTPDIRSGMLEWVNAFQRVGDRLYMQAEAAEGQCNSRIAGDF